MTGFEAGQYLNTIPGAILFARLCFLGLFRAYLAFSCFLFFELFQSIAFILLSTNLSLGLDYRIIWISLRCPALILTLWTVYALLSAVLKSLPGILKLSQRLLAGVFLTSLLVGILTIQPEYQAAAAGKGTDIVKQITILARVAERALTMSAFLALLAILVFFIVWFPVEIPRNLVMFSIGLVVYLGAKTSLLLARTYFPHISRQAYDDLNLTNTLVLAVCFLCWSAVISRAGQKASVRVGHRWQAQEQMRLIIQLEAMNTTLLRARN
jgi:hypothetical protein